MYDYQRKAAFDSFLSHRFAEFARSFKDELVAKAARYTGGQRDSAKVTWKNGILEVVLWLDMGEGSNKGEAEELSRILLGDNVDLTPHSLVPNMWIAHKSVMFHP